MAAINDLIDKITDESLRKRISEEVARLQRHKKFGLVYENHLPEVVPLPEVKIAIGSFVSLKDSKMSKTYFVRSIEGQNAICHCIETNKDEKIPIVELQRLAVLGEPIYPYLKYIDSVKGDADSDLWHTLIEADNYHALQLLQYLYAGKVDCIYIDPPYNKPDSHDWKYNCDYVDSTDSYRHSKWLSMMENRLKIAKKLLNPKSSVLIVTIDELEYHHLACLLEQMFPEGNIQMVTSVISGKGVSRDGQFSRVEEYIFFITFGNMPVLLLDKTMLNDFEEGKKSKKNVIDFLGFRRRNKGNFRTSRPNQFYPVIVNNNSGQIVEIGDAITPDIRRVDVKIPDGCTGLWPLDPSGSERIWSLVPESARLLLKKGCLKVVNWNKKELKGSVKYLASGMVEDIEKGIITIDEKDMFGNIVSGHYTNMEDATSRPRKVWVDKLHNASTHGTLILKKTIGEKRFDFPKSLYAVHDAIRFFVANNPDALILDFFAGSGTTLHAVNLLNAEDGGHRRCIMVTNNEIGEPKEKELKPLGFKPGDEEWEKWGIARYVNWPRTKCSILGVDTNNKPIEGEYITTMNETKEAERHFTQISFMSEHPSKQQKKSLCALINKQKNVKLPTLNEDVPYIVSDDSSCNASILFNYAEIDSWLEELEGKDNITEFYIVTESGNIFTRIKEEVKSLLGPIKETVQVKRPMKDGFKANAIYFKLGFLDKTEVALGRQFRELLPILWMKTGAIGECPQLKCENVPEMLILPQNRFAVLADETKFASFAEKISKVNSIKTVFLVTDSAITYKEMASALPVSTTYQLYRDYLDNFRINRQR